MTTALTLAPAVHGTDTDREPDFDVQHGLDKTDKGKAVGSLRNVVHVLSTEERWRGRIRWSKVEELVLLDAQPLCDTDLTSIAIWLDEVYGLRASTDNLHRAIDFVAAQNAFHGVRDWLTERIWDGVPRHDSLLSAYMAAHDTPLHRKFSSSFLIGACARVFEPGCQVDTMLMLIGKQGAGKSRVCAALPPVRAWFGESGFDIGNKDSFMTLHGKWCRRRGSRCFAPGLPRRKPRSPCRMRCSTGSASCRSVGTGKRPSAPGALSPGWGAPRRARSPERGNARGVGNGHRAWTGRKAMLSPRENTPSMMFRGWTDMDGARLCPSMLRRAWTGQFVQFQPPLIGPSGLSGVSNIGKQSGLESPRSQS